MTRTHHVVGCMSGTSIDAVDAALVRIDDVGLSMRTTPLHFATRPLGPLAEPLRHLASQQPCTAGQVAALSHQFSMLHIDAIRAAAREQPLDLIAVHGQTIFHRPPLSWQLLNPTPIAQAFRTPVVFDMRAADLAAGGQGAPITPLADFMLFRSEHERRAIVNLGGFVNYTVLPATNVGQLERCVAQIAGGDVCACNQLLDTIARELFDRPFDEAGGRAASGAVRPALLETMQAILNAQASAGRSLGTGDELAGRVRQWSQQFAATDVARTACEAVARVVAARLPAVDRIVVAGGGVQNLTLLTALQSAITVPVQLSDDFGIPSAYREAVAMAVLGALCQDRVPITLPAVTHVTGEAPLAGVWVLP